MKFGYCFEAPTAWPEMLEVARTLDQRSNFDSLWLAESLVPNGPLDEPKLEVWAALAAIAQATTRLRLGMLVAGNAYRHPAVLAKIVTTIDHISGGRVTLGLGAGWPGENRRFGIEFWNRRERYERLVEAVQVIKLLWTQPRPVFEGRYYHLHVPPYSPPNVQRSHPPILIGGGSEPMLRAIARYADLASPMIPVSEARSKVAAYCAEIGREPGEIGWVGGGNLFLHDDPAVQARAIEYAIQAGYGANEEEIRSNGPFGSAENVRANILRQVEDGVTEVVVFQLPRVHLRSLMRFSAEVIPHFGSPA
jgi:alkanesulfonate monooxygenase SsuD/methylene tetrahydromethanopterin reductase-like flavin-dependent oxidoreductase (luciferase family)